MVSHFQNFQIRNVLWPLLFCGIAGGQSSLSAASFPEAETGQEAEQKKVYALPEGAEMSEVRELIFLTESLSGEETGKKEFLLRVNGTPEFHAGFTSALKIARDGNPRETQTERVVREALKQTVSWKFEELHLETFAEALQKLLPVPVVLDPESLPAENWEENAGPVDFSGLTLRSVLDHLFVSHHLEWFIQDEKFFLTDADGGSVPLELRRYPLPESFQKTLDQRFLSRSLQQKLLLCAGELLTNTVLPETWTDCGGNAQWLLWGRHLLISQTRRGHEELASFFAQWENAWASEKDGGTAFPQFSVRTPTHRALKRGVSLDFRDLPLENALAELEKALGVRILKAPDLKLPASEKLSMTWSCAQMPGWKALLEFSCEANRLLEKNGGDEWYGIHQKFCFAILDDHLLVVDSETDAMKEAFVWRIPDEVDPEKLTVFLTKRFFADGCSEEEIKERLALGINDSIFHAKPLRMLAIYREPLTLFPAKEFLQELSQTKEVPPKFRFSDPPEDVLEPNAKDGSDISEMDLFENGAFLDAFPLRF